MDGPARGRRCCSVLPPLLALAVAALAVSETAFGAVACFFLQALPFALFGVRASSGVMRFLLGLPTPAARPKDVDGQLCEAASHFLESAKALIVPTGEATRAFEAACRRAVATLDGEARAELEAQLRAGLLVQLLQAEQEGLPEGGYADDWRTCGARFGRKAEAELEGTALYLAESRGLLPLQERVVEASEVGRALQRAEVARFDARALLPARMFNVSVAELSEMHPGPDAVVYATSDQRHGHEDPVCTMLLFSLTQMLSRRGPGSLLGWLLERGLTEGLLLMSCHEHWTLRELAARINGFALADFGLSDARTESRRLSVEYFKLASQGRGLFGSNINTLRLPDYTRGGAEVQAVAEKLGLGGLVEHAHNLLWLGASPGGMHTDFQDNVLVQIAGVSEVLLVPANCSLALGHFINDGMESVHADWLQERGPDFPFFLVRLAPGDGLAIPSNTFHTVVSRDPRRIGMNFFFEPRYGQMRWPSAPANYFNYASKGRLAMRSLWVKTIKDMWEHRRPGARGLFIHGQRQELV